MKKAIVLPLLAMFLAAGPATASYVHGTSVFGQLFYPFTKIYTSVTKYFDIVYSDDSAETAAYLSTFADAMFEKLTGIMSTKVNGRITVVLASAPQTENGFSLPFPYTHIVLADYQTHLVLNQKDYLKGIFLHELMHAVSLNVKSDLFDGLCRFFGAYLNPNYAMPEFMIEGVTVSFESMEGFGRVNDPVIAEEIRQDILENRFKDPSQASAAYDLYPSGNIFYHYGGFFNAYLQKKYGMEKYVRLWEENGGSFPYTMPPVFDNVYPTNFFDEWSMFRDSMAYGGPVETNLLTLEPSCRMQKKSGVENLVVAGGRIVFSDSFDRDVKSYDPAGGKLETLFDGDGELAVSADGKILLVTSKTLINGIGTSVTRFYDLVNRRFLDRVLLDLGFASFFNDSVLAVKARGHKTDLILVGPDNSNRTLLKGTETVSYYNPLQLDSNRIVFILSDNGDRKIAVLRLDNGKLSVLEPDAGFKIDYPVGLYAQDGKVMFSYNSDRSFYKAGILSEDRLYLQTNNVSGGVFNPVIVGDGIFYIGSFSEGKLLLRYPARLKDWNGIVTGARWKEHPQVAADLPENYPLLKKNDYNSLPYLFPHFFVPYLTIGKDYVPDSLGIFTMMYDPFYDNNITLITTYNYIKQLLNVNADWTSTALPVALHLNFADTVSYISPQYGYIRQTGGYAEFSYTLYGVPSYYHLQVGGRLSMYLASFDNGLPSAYNWDYVRSQPVWSLYAAYSTAVKKEYFYDYKGFSLNGYYDYNLSGKIYKTELVFYYYPSFLPVVIRLDAAASPWRVLGLGAWNGSFGYNHYPVFKEYANNNDPTLNFTNASLYYVDGEFKFPLFDLEIQRGPWLLPIYFNRFYMTAGYRAAYLESGYFHSLFLRSVLIASPIYGGYVPTWNLYFEVNYRLNTGGWGIDYSYSYAF